MYEEFNDLIDIYGITGNEPSEQWYDMYYEDGCEALEKFDEKDWQRLKEELVKKSDAWKECMVFCFDDNENQHEIDILNELSNTENDNLLTSIADRIRLCFEYDKIKNIDTIMQRASEIKDHMDGSSQTVLNSFLKNNKKGKHLKAGIRLFV